MTEIRPQKGFQEQFLSSMADIVVGGGAAGAGKTYALLMEPLRHIDVPGFGSVTFRRESSQIANEGGPWDTAQDLYMNFDAVFVESPKHTARFKRYRDNGGSFIVKFTFSHMQHEKHTKQWDGSQIPLICFDELQHFTEKQFWYMLSRNRTTCGVRPYVRATCNPDPDSFLVDLLEWWIDQETGDPIPERSGAVRWFVRIGGIVHWEDTPEELLEKYPKSKPKSFTFIMGTLEDNQILMHEDPDYEANIEAMLDYEKRRLKGNWFARPQAGELFNRRDFEVIDESDFDFDQIVNIMRYWDRAATEPNEENTDPDWTAGVLMASLLDGRYIILDVDRDRVGPGEVENMITWDVDNDSPETVLGLEQEPGASGKKEVWDYEEKFGDKRDVQTFPKTKDKLTCWKPLARASKKNKIMVLKAPWNRAFFNEAENVTDGTQTGHDDQMDSASGAYNYLSDDGFGVGSF